MYPFLFINGGQATPHADDIAIFSSLYPEPTFAATTGTITGSILGPNGTTPLTGVNVIARNILNPYDDAVSAISSDFTDNFAPGSPFVGVYTLRGLTPGASYAVYVDQINTFGGQIALQHAAAQPARTGGVLQRAARIQQRGHRPAQRLHTRPRRGGRHGA